MAKLTRNQRGVSVIEVLIALGMGAIIIASVGNVLLSVKRISAESTHKEKAVAYAKQEIERLQASVNSLVNNPFSCSVVAPATSCSNGSPDPCTPLQGYSSCWSKYPKNSSSNGPWYIDDVLTWHSGTETFGDYSRSIQITNTDPDCTVVSPIRCNVKKVVSTVSWVERGQNKSITLTSILSAWKNQ
ncbi:MAG: hypothetical protein V1907_00940 [Candidatus Kerfeldbacteria bacterium]